MPDIFIPQLVELWRQGRFPFDRLIQKFPLAAINDSVHLSETGEVLKAGGVKASANSQLNSYMQRLLKVISSAAGSN